MTYHVRPGLVFDTESQLDNQAETKKGSEEAIGADARIVAIQCALNRAERTNLGAEVWSRRWDSHGESGERMMISGETPAGKASSCRAKDEAERVWRKLRGCGWQWSRVWRARE